MPASEPPGWDPDATGEVPVGPEPEPTGAGGGRGGGSGGGPGGWGGAPRVEPFAIAALVWAVVSIVVPVIGTIVAFVLAARAADLIRRSQGERTGAKYVTAARVIAGVVLALWIIGGIAFLALRDGDSSDGDNAAIPTQPPSTTLAPATTSSTLPPTTTRPPATTTSTTTPPPTISVIPPPATTAPPTAPQTTGAPPTSVAPTTAPPTTAPPTTAPPTTTTNPNQGKAEKVQERLVARVGPSNRGVPEDDRFAVSYTPGQDLLVTWAINNGSTGAHPTGTPTCSAPPTTAPPTSSTTSTTSSTTALPGTTTTSSPTTTSSTTTSTTTTGAPGTGRTTQEQARYEAKQMLQSIKPQLATLGLDVPGVQLVGTYPIQGTTDVDVVQVLYSKATVNGTLPDYKKMFEVPPAKVVQCLNPAFKLP